jgi:hypothetical protein
MVSLLLDILPQNRYIFNEIYLFVYFLIIVMRALGVSVLTLRLIPLYLHFLLTRMGISLSGSKDVVS